MEYAKERALTTAAAYLRGANAPIEAKSIDSLLDRMTKELNAIAENTSRLTHFKNRLLNPRPQGVGDKEAESPVPGSVEGRMQALIQMARNIGAHLNETVNELDRAA